MKKKVLVTASTFPRYEGDTYPRFVLDFCKSWVMTDELECLVLAPHSKGSKTTETLEGINVKRYRYFFPDGLERLSGNGIVPFLKKNPPFFLMVPFFLLFQLISTILAVRQYKPDIIVANWIFPQGLIAALIKSLFPDVKLITVTLGGDVALIKNNFLIRKLVEHIFKKVDKVVAVSNFLKEVLMEELGLSADYPIATISMAVDEKLFKTIEKPVNNNKNILFVGRLVEKKGVNYLINAMQKVLSKYPDTTLHIAGDGPLKRELVVQAEMLNLQNNVIFHGAVEHSKLPALFAQALIFVAPSVNTSDDLEGLPTVLTEAVASKIPVITTDAGGITDLITNTETGIIVEQRNSEQLAEKIIELLGDSLLSTKLAESAYNKLLEGFTFEKTGEKYRKIIFECIGEKYDNSHHSLL